ncbi:hypothetical protein JI750_07735 [Flavobacterium sp. GN10]|uniref:Uncharacterized protein n=1 Tax=Flavobacterium tagetis TaxID=2801336 RepID=A0ABS1KB93_9FLAO|nr:hypothetical protein [Flavobacterium tagetis]MBL0736769.1 hypothetical protein [Flavobacterium tagetis]
MKENAQSNKNVPSSSTQHINKPLKLNTVNKGEPTDNILVHSIDNEVKSISRNEFGGGPQNLDQVLENGHMTTNRILFNDTYYNWLETEINSRYIRLTDNNADMLVGIDSAGVSTREGDQQTTLNPQGIFFNTDGIEAYLRNNRSSVVNGVINLPITDGKEITLATTDDFKGLESTLAAQNHANYPIILSDYYVSPEYYQGLKLFASTGNTFLQNHYSGRITGFVELKPGNLGLIQHATDGTSGSASIEVYGGGYGNLPEISFRKYVDGIFSLCTAQAGDPLKLDDLTTKRYVDAQTNGKAPIDSPIFTGTPSVPTAGPTTNNTQIASTAFVNNAIANSSQNLKPYKVWTAVISQAYTDAPIINAVFQNDFGGTVVASRVDVGTYRFTLGGAFKGNFLSPQNGTLVYQSCCDSYGAMSVQKINDNQIEVRTTLVTMDQQDQLLGENMIEFRIYN